MVSVDDLWEVLHGLFKEPIIGPLNSKWQMANILKIVFFWPELSSRLSSFDEILHREAE